MSASERRIQQLERELQATQMMLWALVYQQPDHTAVVRSDTVREAPKGNARIDFERNPETGDVVLTAVPA